MKAELGKQRRARGGEKQGSATKRTGLGPKKKDGAPQKVQENRGKAVRQGRCRDAGRSHRPFLAGGTGGTPAAQVCLRTVCLLCYTFYMVFERTAAGAVRGDAWGSPSPRYFEGTGGPDKM